MGALCVGAALRGGALRGCYGHKFVHRTALSCAELLLFRNFVHEKGVSCAEYLPGRKFVHRTALSCAELLLFRNFVHEKGISAQSIFLAASLCTE